MRHDSPNKSMQNTSMNLDVLCKDSEIPEDALKVEHMIGYIVYHIQYMYIIYMYSVYHIHVLVYHIHVLRLLEIFDKQKIFMIILLSVKNDLY